MNRTLVGIAAIFCGALVMLGSPQAQIRGGAGAAGAAVTVPSLLGVQSVSATGVDDTVALQAACDAGGAGSTHDTVVLLAPGTYKVSTPVLCNNIVAWTGSGCSFWYEGYVCNTIIQQIAGTWASGDAVIKATAGKTAYYHGIEVTCGVSSGADGVSAFELGGGLHGVKASKTFAYRCYNGYNFATGNGQQFLCEDCIAVQNQLWAMNVEGGASLADSEVRGALFMNNGVSTTAVVNTGGINCNFCVGVAVIGGQIEDNYGSAANGFIGVGIRLINSSLAIRIIGVKFDQNENGGDVQIYSTVAAPVTGVQIIGNISTSCRSVTFPCASENKGIWFTGTGPSQYVFSMGNYWGTPHQADVVASQLVGSQFADQNNYNGADAYTAQLMSDLTLASTASDFGRTQKSSVYAAPAATTNTTGVMMGLGASATPALILTPKMRTTATINCGGTIANNTIAGVSTVGLRYGTGSAPANGAALTGTDTGVVQTYVASTAAGKGTFNLTAVASSLLVPMFTVHSTPYWIDLTLKSGNGAHTATITDAFCTVTEG